MKEKKKLEFPHPFAIILLVIALMTMATHLIPAGAYNRIAGVDGRMMVDPDSFHLIDPTPAGFSDFLLAIPRGFAESAEMVCFTLLIGAGVAVINAIGLIPAAVESLAGKFKNKGIWIIPILMVAIAVCDAVLGTNELCLLYVPIILPLVLKLGFDSMTAVGLVLVSSASGFTAALFNPFSIAISQRIAGLPLYSGLGLRVVALVAFTLAGIIYVMRYASKVALSPEASLTFENDCKKRAEIISGAEKTEKGKLSLRQRTAAVFACIVLAVMIYGLLEQGWDLPEMGACFIVIGVVCGVIARMKVRDICETMIIGCNDMMYGAILIALARGISVVMTHGNILDSIVNFFAGILKSISPSVSVIGAFILVSLLNCLITSASGKAVVIFPIMAPLADILGFTRQTAVLAYQFGDGFTNYFWPAGGVMHGCCAAAGVSYSKWLKFYTPVLLIFSAMACVFLIVAQIIEYGPF